MAATDAKAVNHQCVAVAAMNLKHDVTSLHLQWLKFRTETNANRGAVRFLHQLSARLLCRFELINTDCLRSDTRAGSCRDGPTAVRAASERR